MYAIKNLLTDDVINVTTQPHLVNGTWECGDQRFTDPQGNSYEPVLLQPAAVTDDHRITQLAFINRFTMEEWIAIDAATATVPTIKYFVTKVNAARYIDLMRAEVRNGVQLLVANGLVTAARAAEILDSPILAIERLDGAGI